jgi:mutator protein MutT
MAHIAREATPFVISDRMRRIRVVAGIIERAGQVLCAQRGPQQDQPGLWEFPGGKVEAGETDAEALARELMEELGVAVKVGVLLATSVHRLPSAEIALLGYRCQMIAGDLTKREHADLRWVDIPALSDLKWAPADLPLVAAILSGSAACI